MTHNWGPPTILLHSQIQQHILKEVRDTQVDEKLFVLQRKRWEHRFYHINGVIQVDHLSIHTNQGKKKYVSRKYKQYMSINRILVFLLYSQLNQSFYVSSNTLSYFYFGPEHQQKTSFQHQHFLKSKIFLIFLRNF